MYFSSSDTSYFTIKYNKAVRFPHTMSTNNALLVLQFSAMIFYCVITSSKAIEVFAWEDYQLMKGEEFCETRKQSGFFFENTCHQIAEENGFKNYNPNDLTAICYKRCTISIFYGKIYDFTTIEEDLLQCRYNSVEGFTITQFASRAIGVGKEKNDVMEYEYAEGITKPYVHRPGLLNKIHVMTLEQYNEQLEGADFCSTKKKTDFLKYMCEKIAEKNNFEDLAVTEVKDTCQETEISMYSRDQRQDVLITGELLLCHYGSDSVQLASRALGRGKGKSDVMEYSFDDDFAVPHVNRPNLLNEIHVLTLEQFELLEGEDFCTTRKRMYNAFGNLCIRIAYANDFEDYDRDSLNAMCWKTSITLFSEKENKFVDTEENLLHCDYKNLKTQGNAKPRINWFASKTLGRGKGKNDVMEYDYSYSESKQTSRPFINRSNFLT